MILGLKASWQLVEGHIQMDRFKDACDLCSTMLAWIKDISFKQQSPWDSRDYRNAFLSI